MMKPIYINAAVRSLEAHTVGEKPIKNLEPTEMSSSQTMKSFLGTGQRSAKMETTIAAKLRERMKSGIKYLRDNSEMVPDSVKASFRDRRLGKNG